VSRQRCVVVRLGSPLGPRTVDLVRWGGAPICAMQAKDVEDLPVVDRSTRGGELIGNPARFTPQLLLLDVDLAAARIGENQPREPGPDDETDDEQPPVELGVHRARVQGRGPMTPATALNQGGRRPHRPRPYTPQS